MKKEFDNAEEAYQYLYGISDGQTDVDYDKIIIEFIREKKEDCGECGKKLKTEEEIDFGQCDKCCAWKYRDCSK